jgi:primosomal protein N' (replication factor Y)
MELYLSLAREFVKRGKGVLILVPELLLTPELRSRVEAYFGENVGIYHGKLTPRERASTWLKALKGEVKVFLGTRAGVMLPIKELGLIIVDEEQDSSYKESQKPYYNAREVALKRAEALGITCLLVSATPSVETCYMVKEGLVKKHSLERRIGGLPLPRVSLISLNEEERIGLFTKPLLSEIERVLKAKKQALIFIPRRGYYPISFCPNCGYTLECKYCKVNLTYHKASQVLLCHLCGRRYRPIFKCPKCSHSLSFKGYGTERVEEELKRLFPGYRVVRLDSDTVKEPIRGAKLVKEIKEGKWDLIVGTQIAIKGHNFPKVKLVAVLVAELAGGAPDFKNSERIFQTIVQAVGRAGRYEPGSAIVQAFNPELPPIKLAVEYKLDEFCQEELLGRELLSYPPYTLGVLLEFQFKKTSLTKIVKDKYQRLSQELSSYFNFHKLNPAPIPKVGGNYRYIAFLTTSRENPIPKLKLLKEKVRELFNAPSKIICKIDVNPEKIV